MTGKELKERRKAMGFTQRKLAEALGYEGRAGECTVQNWEYDKQPIPLRHYKKLSKLLDLTLEEMLPD